MLPTNATITILRAGLVADPYGNKIPDWPNASQTVINVFQSPLGPSPAQEDIRQRDTTMQWKQIRFTSSVVNLLTTDRVLLDGLTWEVWGQVEKWNTLTNSTLHHYHAFLRTVLDA